MPKTQAEIREQLVIVGDGIAALQSLDDLGPEGNARAARDLEELWRRHTVLQDKLAKFGAL